MTIEKFCPETFIFLSFLIPIAEECFKTLQKHEYVKGLVSRHEYFFEGPENPILTFGCLFIGKKLKSVLHAFMKSLTNSENPSCSDF